MSAAVLKQQFESLLGGQWDWQSRPAPETAATGIAEIDAAIGGGLPRGCLTEIVGPPSSGRSSLLGSILAQATARQEACALVDAEDCFDPVSAVAAGVELERLLWVRCEHNAEHALKAVDLLIQGGGFGVVAMDLGDTPPETARRISLTSWFRLRRAVEHTPTVLITVARRPNARTCASLMLECAREQVEWSGARFTSRLLRGVKVRATANQRRKACSPVFTAEKRGRGPGAGGRGMVALRAF
jgi:recombination protein RecA